MISNKVFGSITGFSCLGLIALSASLNTINSKNTEPVDSNVYLNETICFGKEIYITLDSLNVTASNEDIVRTDDDNDELSNYTLNIGALVEQKQYGLIEDPIKLKPSNFFLRSVNVEAKTKMEVFIDSLFKSTIETAVGLALSGEVNIIEELISYVEEYTTASIENAEYSNVDFKPIKCTESSFEPFYPKDYDEPVRLKLSFPIKKKYLESNNIIVLCVDQWNHIERRILLMTRPQK